MGFWLLNDWRHGGEGIVGKKLFELVHEVWVPVEELLDHLEDLLSVAPSVAGGSAGAREIGQDRTYVPFLVSIMMDRNLLYFSGSSWNLTRI